MRIFSVLLALLGASCTENPGPSEQEPIGITVPGLVPCRLAGKAKFENICRLKIGKDLAVRTIIAPDGSFRRLRSIGEEYEAADGAEPAINTVIKEDVVEVAVGGDTYRLSRPVP